MATTFPVLDATADPARTEFCKLAQLYELPDYVRRASPAAALDPDPSLASTCYADVRRRQFKCASKAATWASYLFFLEKQGSLHPKVAGWIRDRLDDFAGYWGIEPDCARLRETHAKLARDRSRDSDYLCVWQDERGDRTREQPLRNTAEVKLAAEWFALHRDAFGYDDRRTMAEKLLEKAASLGCALGGELDELLEKQSGRGVYDPRVAARALRDRVKAATPPPGFAGRLEKLARALESNPALAVDAETTRQLCRTLDAYDRMCKLAGQYGPALPRPEDLLCGALWKTAEETVRESCQLVTGSVYDRRDFAKLALSQLRGVFGDRLAREVADGVCVDPVKLAEAARTLPGPDARVLDDLLAEQGVFPLLKHATSTERPDPQELAELARIRRGFELMPRAGARELGLPAGA